MPIAVPLLDALGGTPEFPQVVQAVEHIARTLADLAADGVSHRDIKPDNLFQLNGEWAVGDFGLVKYPERESATRHGRRLGPLYFMAPEMRQNADTANAELADVYSLAKHCGPLQRVAPIRRRASYVVIGPSYSSVLT